MNTPVRNNPIGALGQDDEDDLVQPTPAKKPMLPKEEVERIARQQGFAQSTAKETLMEEGPTPARQQRRRRTGRNAQINIKATPEAIDRLYRISDKMNKPLGEILELALEALEKDS